MSTTAVFGVASNRAQAERIASELKAAGFSGNDISVLFPNKAGTRDFGRGKHHTKAPEAAAAGASTAGMFGGGLGLLVSTGPLAIPGIGPIIAAGPLMAALGGAALGAAVGGLAGALVGLGVPEFEAKQYEGKIREGNILISVHAENSNEVSRAKVIFKREGAHDISSTAEASVRKSA